MTNELPPGGSEREFGPGDVVVLEGDQADVVHVVATGSVRVIAGDDELRGVINTLGQGDLIGDVAAFTGEARSATAVALEPTTTRAIPVEEFVEWAQAEPARAAALLAEARRRVDRRRAMDVLIPLFGLTEPAQVAAVLDQLGWQHLAAGDTLFRAGEAGDAAYLVVGGRIAISAEDRSGEV